MHMVMNLKNNETKIINVFILLIGFFTFFIIFVFKLQIPCFIKKTFKISCPGCGMTRAIEALFKFDLISAFNYNILSIPITLFAIICIFILVYDVIKNTSLFINLINCVFTKFWYMFILLIIASMLINNIRY